MSVLVPVSDILNITGFLVLRCLKAHNDLTEIGSMIVYVHATLMKILFEGLQ